MQGLLHCLLSVELYPKKAKLMIFNNTNQLFLLEKITALNITTYKIYVDNYFTY